MQQFADAGAIMPRGPVAALTGVKFSTLAVPNRGLPVRVSARR
jgi:hypothetical protein